MRSLARRHRQNSRNKIRVYAVRRLRRLAWSALGWSRPMLFEMSMPTHSALGAKTLVPCTCVLVVAHSPLSHAFHVVARHVFGEVPVGLRCVDVRADTGFDACVRQAIRHAGRTSSQSILILVDACGATPHRIAQRVAEQTSLVSTIVTGVNLPMVLGVLGMAGHGAELEELAANATRIGREGVRSGDARAWLPTPP